MENYKYKIWKKLTGEKIKGKNKMEQNFKIEKKENRTNKKNNRERIEYKVKIQENRKKVWLK